jgi:hypothetical protein
MEGGVSSGVVYIPLYVSDWRGNAKLARCSMAAHGVWINLLCIMADADECGVLVVDGEVWGDEEIVGVIGGNRKVVLNALNELRVRKVLRQRKSDGAYYSSRLMREGRRIRKRSESARMAAEARWGHADAMRTQCDRNADALPTQCVEDADAMPTRTRVRTRTRTRKNTSEAAAISWSPDDGWQGITDADRTRWAEAYPACDLDRQLASMTAWLGREPDEGEEIQLGTVRRRLAQA